MDKSRRRSTQYWYFKGENVSWALINSVKVTATELFFTNSSVYIEIDRCVEAGKQVIFPNLNLFNVKLCLMGHTGHNAMGSFFSINCTNTFNINFFNIIQPAWDTERIIAGDEAHSKDILRMNMSAEHLKTDWSHVAIMPGVLGFLQIIIQPARKRDSGYYRYRFFCCSNLYSKAKHFKG